MAVTFFTDDLKARWGLCGNKPLLPSGFTYIENPYYWLLAESDDREKFYVGFDGSLVYLTPLKIADWWDYLRTRGKLKVGHPFADTGSRTAFPRVGPERK